MSVAIRTATRVQDQDDVNVTVGAGVDGYALVWDNGAGEFVLAAAGVTDHGALTGLSDDDHSQYLLATGARTGASSQAQTFTVGITLADTTTSTSGVVFKGADRFIHNFHHPTGGGAVPTGGNTFVGVNSGNFTTGATATQTYHASSNTGVGTDTLKALTFGWTNTAIGFYAMRKITEGAGNVAIGYLTGDNFLTCQYNVAVGAQALANTTSGNNNTGLGYQALIYNTTGSNNIGLGYRAGMFQANGSSQLTDPENSIYIGYGTRGYNNSDSNSIVIGYSAIGLGANTTVIGNTSTTAATIYGAGAFPLVSAATNTVSNLLTLTHDTSGTAAAGFGAGQLFRLESSTTAAQDAARIRALWYEATHATRKADLVLAAYDTAEREGLRIRGAGSAPAIGFLGAEPAARIAHVADPSGGATVDAEARSAINSILATLETFGFHATS